MAALTGAVKVLTMNFHQSVFKRRPSDSKNKVKYMESNHLMN